MGLLDRDYYRDDESGPLATWIRQGLVTKVLFTICAVTFVIQISTQERFGSPVSGPFAEALCLNGERVIKGEVWRLATYVFLSSTSNLLAFLFNMPLLWVAGQVVEERLGRQRFLAFFLGSGIIAGLAFVGAMLLGLRGASLDATRVVGCTAPLTALLAWLTLQSPRLNLNFFYSLPVPAWLLLVLTVGMDVYGVIWPRIPTDDGRRITLAGHFGALMAAMMFHALLRSAGGYRPRRRSVPQSDPDVRIYHDEPPDTDDEELPAPVGSAPDVDEHLEAQLDAVLAKVASHGQESLTSAEREILKRASEVYRKRRR